MYIWLHVPTPRQISPGRSFVSEKKSGSTHKNFPCNSRVPSRVRFLLVPLCTPSTLKDVVTLSATHNNHHHHHHHLSLPLLSLSLLTLFNSVQIQSIFSSGVIFIDKKKRKQKFLFSQNIQVRNSNMTFRKRYLISVNDFTYHTRRCLVYIASHISPMQQYQARGLMSIVRIVSLYQSILHLEKNKCLLTGTSISNQTHVGIE